MAFISSFRHPVTSFRFRSVTLVVSNYVVAYRFLRLFKVLTDMIVYTPRGIYRAIIHNSSSYKTYRSSNHEIKCYRTAFYPYFCIITIQPSVPFYHSFLQTVLPDRKASWVDYILWYLNHRFTTYALRLTLLLNRAFTLWLWLLTMSQLISFLINRGLLGSFTAIGNIVSNNAFIRLTHMNLPIV